MKHAGKERVWVNEEAKRMSRGILTDPTIYECEIEQICNRSGLFLGYETELAQSGAYGVRPMGDDHAIVVRGEDETFHLSASRLDAAVLGARNMSVFF